jgi:hypothetical protein
MASTRHLPTTPSGLADALAQLAGAIARDGVAPHTNDVVRLGRLAELHELPAGAIDALLDPCSAPIVRERAAVTLSLAADRDPSAIRATEPLHQPVARVNVPLNTHLERHGGLPLR